MQTAVPPEVSSTTPEEDEWMAYRGEFAQSRGPENSVLRWVSPKQLSKHPSNIEIYGDQRDPKFLESVRRHGILAPLVVVKIADGKGGYILRILSGHKRWQAAIILGIERVPVWEHQDALTELEQRRELLAANEQRQMTNEQRTRHYSAALAVEKELSAQKRSAAGGSHQKALGKNFPKRSDRAPKAKETAAAAAGFSVPTADQAAEVVGEADRRKAAGDEAGARALIETLNNGSVAEAHRIATQSPEQSRANGPIDPAGQLIPERLRPIFEADALLAKAQKGLGAAHAALVELAKGPANVFGTQELQTEISRAHGAIKFRRPFIVCPICTKGAGTKSGECLACKDHPGWLTKDQAFVGCIDHFPAEVTARVKALKAKTKRGSKRRKGKP